MNIELSKEEATCICEVISRVLDDNPEENEKNLYSIRGKIAEKLHEDR